MRLSDIVRSGQRAAPPAGAPSRPAGEAADRGGRPLPREAEPALPEPAPSRRTEPEPPRPTAGVPPEGDRARPRPEPPAEPRNEPALDGSDLVFQRAVERIRHALAVRAQAPFSIGQAEEAVEILLQSLETDDALLMSFFRATGLELNQARKAVNVAILSLKMGLELAYPRDQLRDLGLAALLCDIGTTLMPAEILGSPEPLTAAERSSLRQHQLEAARLLEKLAPGYRWLQDVIGRRYATEAPYQAGNRFEEYAAVIHLADMYRSLVHPRTSRKRIGPLDALKEILQRHRALFPDRILKALIRAMSTFPVGSLVRLNTGDVARVVQRSRDYPLRPVVEVLVRRGKRLPAPARVDLVQSPLLYIKESVVEEDAV
ncbi:MAG: hypothetical protein HY359_02315 [Candidatus Rokubacteria bacterium]|nr:hypothetical protein [Candidatus Rokubacteria bacterium]